MSTGGAGTKEASLKRRPPIAVPDFHETKKKKKDKRGGERSL